MIAYARNWQLPHDVDYTDELQEFITEIHWKLGIKRCSMNTNRMELLLYNYIVDDNFTIDAHGKLGRKGLLVISN